MGEHRKLPCVQVTGVPGIPGALESGSMLLVVLIGCFLTLSVPSSPLL